MATGGDFNLFLVLVAIVIEPPIDIVSTVWSLV